MLQAIEIQKIIEANLNCKFSGKLNNKGSTCMFAGYATDHAGNVYRMLNVVKRKKTSWLYKLKDKSSSFSLILEPGVGRYSKNRNTL